MRRDPEPHHRAALEGEPVAPMLAVISHAEGSTEVNGKTVKAAGVGKRQPWGGKRLDARWVVENGRTKFMDEAGNKVPLSRGKTYIALWDEEGIGEMSWEK